MPPGGRSHRRGGKDGGGRAWLKFTGVRAGRGEQPGSKALRQHQEKQRVSVVACVWERRPPGWGAGG